MCASVCVCVCVSVSAASKVKYLNVVESFDWHLTAYEAQSLSLE